MTIYRKFRRALLLTLSVVLIALPAAAEDTPADLTDLSLENLMGLSVYGASRFEQKVGEAPSSVSVIRADEIKKFGYRTLAELLRSIRGFSISYDRNYHYAGIRGFNRPGDYNARLLLLIDGHRVNDNIYNQAPLGTDFPLDLDLIERIEIIRGPGSSLYGDNAFFGVINIITRSGPASGELSGAAGSRQTYESRASLGRRLGSDLDLLVSGSFMESRGSRRLYFREFDNPEENNGIAEQGDADRSRSVFTRLRYQDLTLEGLYNTRTKGVPTGVFDTVFNDPRNNSHDEHALVDLKYRHTFAEATTVTARLYYDFYTYRGTYVYTALNKDKSVSDAVGGELLVAKQLFEKHKLLAGLEVHRNLRLYQHNYNEAPFETIFSDDRHSQQWAFFVQDEFHLFDSLILNGGIRYDQYSTFGSTLNPRMALLYKPLENSTLKLLYGEAFRAPSAFEFFYAPVQAGQKANPQLKPEKIRTYEMTYEHYIGRQCKVSVSGFMNSIRHLITQRLDPADNLLVFVNSPAVKARGLEFELEGQGAGGVQGRLSYSFSKTRDSVTGKSLSNSPEHLGKLNVLIPVPGSKLFLGLEEQYTSQRTTPDGSKTRGFAVTNVTLLARNVAKGLEISVSGYNLFNTRYSDPGVEDRRPDAIPQDGRSFRVKLTYAFP